jgi:hypothetical protein
MASQSEFLLSREYFKLNYGGKTAVGSFGEQSVRI